MDAQEISKCIGVEEATNMGHMKKTQQGIKSTTIKSGRGRPSKIKQQSDRTNATQYAIYVPTQEPKKRKQILCLSRYSDQKDSFQATRPENFPGCQTEAYSTYACSTFTIVSTLRESQ